MCVWAGCVCVCGGVYVVSDGVGQERLVGWLVDWSARSEEIKVQKSGLRVATSHFFRGRGQLDDLIFRGLANDVFLEAEVGKAG